MTATTVSNAVATRDAGAAELVRQSRDWFRTIVPSHVDANAFVALSIGYLRKSPKLAAAAVRNPQAFTAALSECARLGLVPGDTYHLVPFENTRGDTVDITGITDYKGEIELIYRAGAAASVKAEIVRKRDHFRYTTDMDRPEHAPDWFGERGELIGAYAYAVMKDGATSKVVIYSKAEIDEVRASSKGASRPDSPWNAWYDRMALKTVIHRLEHFVPTSAEYRREQLRAAAEVSQQVNLSAPPSQPAAAAVVVNASTGEVVDAEIVDDPPAPKPEPGGRRQRGQQRQQAAPPAEEHPWPEDAAPARPARNADPAIIGDGDAGPTTSGASSSARAPGSASRTRNAEPSPSSASGSGTTPGDPRDAVIAHLDRLKVVSYGPQGDVMTAMAGRGVASAEQLGTEEAATFAVRLSLCKTKAQLDVMLKTGEVPGAD